MPCCRCLCRCPLVIFMSDFLETIKKKYIVVLDVHTENGYADWHIDSATSVVWG